ncbi:MAG TPA: hypothetical protein VGV10_04630 [Thermoleophilaceae bacterium]|nr:hypothetical protein [Thermoleophilaceae bacterium]
MVLDELATADCNRAKSFFGELLGSEFETDERDLPLDRERRQPQRRHAGADRAGAVRDGRFAVVTDPQGAAFAVFEGETDP